MMLAINYETLKSLSDEVGSYTASVLLNAFSEELDSYYIQLLKMPSLDKIAEVSHAVTSSAASFGADELADLVREWDSRAKLGQMKWIKEKLPHLLRTLHQSSLQYRALAIKENLLNCTA